jgi:oxygen-dependent protoporphyrinogen oxidase
VPHGVRAVRVAIVGAGLAGLTTAFELRRRESPEHPLEVTLLESADRAGGPIRTERVDTFLVEAGPNGFLDSAPDTLALVDRLEVRDRLLPSSDSARRRFVFRRGRLHALPENPFAFLASPLLSPGGRARVLLEPFAGRRPEGDESVRAFASRRIGTEAADVLVDAMVSGVFAGDPARLSLRACFPAMWQMETEHGGLVRALFARRRKARRPEAAPRDSDARSGSPVMPRGRLTSFEGGMQDLVDALARACASSLRLGIAAKSVYRHADPNADTPWTIETASGDTLPADVVVLATPAHVSARLVSALDPELSSVLASIPSAPLAVVALAFDAAVFGGALDGFGFLAPGHERFAALGVLWDSSIYPNRAPAGRVLLRVILGGARASDVPVRDDTALVDLAREALRLGMGVAADPLWTRIVRHVPGLPQYTLGHLDRLQAIDARLEAHPGLYLTGNSYRGVAMNSCITDAIATATKILERR